MAGAGRGAYISAMIDDLYSAKLLKLAANMPHIGRLPAPDASSEKVAKLCGSRVVVDHGADVGAPPCACHCASARAFSASLMAWKPR